MESLHTFIIYVYLEIRWNTLRCMSKKMIIKTQGYVIDKVIQIDLLIPQL